MMLLVESILLSYLLLSASISGISSSKIVSLESIQIFSNHNFLPFKPTIYFQCRGERAIILPDVKEINVLYTFKGEESWQPLTELPETKCKRCGVYQKSFFKADDIFDEWELCLDDFSNGISTHFKEYQLNATFSCPVNGTSRFSSLSNGNHKHMSAAWVATITIAVLAIIAIGSVAGYKYWQKRKREQDQLRFLKMFEEGDDFEDELGLDPL